MSSRTTDRYRNDPDYRAKQKLRSRLNYFKNKPIIKKPDLSQIRTEFYAIVPIRNPFDARYGGSVRVPVFRIGGLAQLFDVSAQTITNWTQAGMLPESTLRLVFGEREDRAYTYDQLRLMWELIPFRNFPDSRDGLAKPGGMTHSAFARTLKQYWQLMPDGVVPIYRPAGRVLLSLTSGERQGL